MITWIEFDGYPQDMAKQHTEIIVTSLAMISPISPLPILVSYSIAQQYIQDAFEPYAVTIPLLKTPIYSPPCHHKALQ